MHVGLLLFMYFADFIVYNINTNNLFTWKYLSAFHKKHSQI